MKAKFIAVVIAAIFSVALAGSAMAEDINAYMGTSPDNNAKIAKFIKDKTGITVNQTFQSFGEIEARVKAEAPNFNADMIIGCGSSTGFMAKKNGWSVPYVIPGLERRPGGIHGSEGRLVQHRQFFLRPGRQQGPAGQGGLQDAGKLERPPGSEMERRDRHAFAFELGYCEHDAVLLPGPLRGC